MALLLSGSLLACTTPSVETEATGEFANEGLYTVKNSGFAEAYVRRGAGLSSYQKIDPEPLDVSDVDIPSTAVAGTLRRDWAMTPEREAALQRAWSNAIGKAFSGYEQASAGEGVLEIQAKITKIAPGVATANTIGAPTQVRMTMNDAIEISAEFRLFNSENGQLLAVVRDNRTIGAAAMSRTAPINMTLLLDSWAALLHTRVSGK